MSGRQSAGHVDLPFHGSLHSARHVRVSLAGCDAQPVRIRIERDADPAIFDLTRVPYMDSIGLGMMVSQHVRCKGKGIRMVAVGVNPRVLQLFKLTKLDTLIPMAATVEEAEAQ